MFLRAFSGKGVKNEEERVNCYMHWLFLEDLRESHLLRYCNAGSLWVSVGIKSSCTLWGFCGYFLPHLKWSQHSCYFCSSNPFPGVDKFASQLFRTRSVKPLTQGNRNHSKLKIYMNYKNTVLQNSNDLNFISLYDQSDSWRGPEAMTGQKCNIRVPRYKFSDPNLYIS